MFKKNQQVKIKPHTRTRTVFNGASHEPGTVTNHPGGQVGPIKDVLDEMGEVTYVVGAPIAGTTYGEFSADELEAAE